MQSYDEKWLARYKKGGQKMMMKGQLTIFRVGRRRVGKI